MQRFISEDPVGLAGGINGYSYTFNNPINFIDPDGRLPLPVIYGLGRLLLGFIPMIELQMMALDDVPVGGIGRRCGVAKSVPNGKTFPDRALPRDKHGNPVPETNAPHTQLGTKSGRNGNYPQAREFDTNGKPVRDIDFTNHGRADHPNPHQHQYLPNATGGTLKRGPTEPLQYP